MLFDDSVESLLFLVRAHPYVRTGHPDFIAIGRVQVRIGLAELVVLNLPGPSPLPPERCRLRARPPHHSPYDRRARTCRAPALAGRRQVSWCGPPPID